MPVEMHSASSSASMFAALATEQGSPRRIVEAGRLRGRELPDVRRARRLLLHDAEQQLFDRPVVQADLPGIVRARQVVVRIAIAELQVESLDAGDAIHERHDRLGEQLVYAVAAFDRQDVAAGAAKAARRRELQALVRIRRRPLVAILGTEADRQRVVRRRELDVVERARHRARHDQLLVSLLLERRRARIGRHLRRDRAEPAEQVDRHAARVSVLAGHAIRRPEGIANVGDVRVATADQHAVRLAIGHCDVVLPVAGDQPARAEQQLPVLVVVVFRARCELDRAAEVCNRESVCLIHGAVAVEVDPVEEIVATRIRGPENRASPRRRRSQPPVCRPAHRRS